MRAEIKRLRRDLELLENPETFFAFGQMSFDGDGTEQDYVAAVNWFRLAAEKGHAKAQHNLGLMYENGLGVAKDFAEAARWYSFAAEQGLAGSQNNLAGLLETGDGVTQDHASALEWYRKAAAGGDSNAASNLERLARYLRSKSDMTMFEDVPTFIGDKFRHIESGFSGNVVKETIPTPWAPDRVLLTLELGNEQREFRLTDLEEIDEDGS